MASAGGLKEHSGGTIGLATSNSTRNHIQAADKESSLKRRDMKTSHTAINGKRDATCTTFFDLYFQLMVGMVLLN